MVLSIFFTSVPIFFLLISIENELEALYDLRSALQVQEIPLAAERTLVLNSDPPFQDDFPEFVYD